MKFLCLKKATSGLMGWIDCFEKAKLAGTVFAGGVNDMGDISGHCALEKSLSGRKRNLSMYKCQYKNVHFMLTFINDGELDHMECR